MTLCGKLSNNKEVENVIPRGYFETNPYQKDLSIVFLALFIL